MRVEMGNVPLEKPNYARSLSDKEFVAHLHRAEPMIRAQGGSYYSDGLSTSFSKEVLDNLSNEPRFWGLVANVVQRGPSGEFGDNWSRCLSILAEVAAKDGQALELVPTENKIKRLPAQADNGQRSDEASIEIANGFGFGEPLPRIGTFLRNGTIICRGDVESVETLVGGTVFVDGNVNKVNQCRSGILYVNGDLYHLGSTTREIIVVSGRIHEYVQAAHHPSGGYYTERIPSPFVFSPHQLEGNRVGEKLPHHHRSNIFAYSNTAKPFDGAFLVKPEDVANWEPEEVVVKALELCRARIDSDLGVIRNFAKNASSIQEMEEIFDKHIVGYVMGKSEGFFKGLND